MKITKLGHTVLKVRDVERAEAFYAHALGLPVAARMDAPRMTFFTLGDHHDFAVMEVGDGPDPHPSSPGLAHVAFRVGDSLADLRAVRDELVAAGVPIDGITDHVVSQSIYLRDPDGNGIELYVDGSDVWKTDPQAVAMIAPLEL